MKTIRKNLQSKTCELCSKEFFANNKIGLVEWDKKRFCNRSCYISSPLVKQEAASNLRFITKTIDYRKQHSQKKGIDWLPSQHGTSKETKFYHTWQQMKRRCSKSKNQADIKNYQVRGITVCERWKEYKYFFIDMWDKYSLHYEMYGRNTQIDRIDNDKGYYPLNCRWVTAKENADNKRNSNPVTYKGKTQNLNDWAAELKIKRSTLSQRIYTYGWTIKKALETPTISDGRGNNIIKSNNK